MTKVFIAGPVDFQDVDRVIEYRLRLRDGLERAGYEPVDQYSDALEQVSSFDLSTAAGLETAAEHLDSLPDEPYLHAIGCAIAETSISTVVENPDVVPRHTPEHVVERIVERDLELVEESDGLIAFMPRPSCGTMTELIHATENDLPTVVVSDAPPHYAQYFASATAKTIDDGIERLADELERPS